MDNSNPLTPDVITAFISTLDTHRTQDVTTTPVTIAPRMHEHLDLQPSAIDYYRQGLLYAQQNEFAKAETCYRLAIKDLQSKSPLVQICLAKTQRKYFEIAGTLCRLGNDLKQKNNHDQAIIAYEHALNYQLKAISLTETDQIHHVDLVSLYDNLAIAYIQYNDFEKANGICKKGLIAVQNIKPFSPQAANNLRRTTAGLYRTLFYVQDHNNNKENALEVMKYIIKTLEAISEKNSEDNKKLANSYDNLGNYFLENGKTQEATQCFEKSIDYYENCLKKNFEVKETQFQIASICNDLAKIYTEQKNLDKVVVCYEKVLKNIGDDPETIENIHARFGQRFLNLQAWKQAANAYKEALKMNELRYKGKEKTPQYETTVADYKQRREFAEKKYSDENTPRQETIKKRIISDLEANERLKKLKVCPGPSAFKPGFFSKGSIKFGKSVAANQNISVNDESNTPALHKTA